MNIQTFTEDLASKNPDRYSRWFAEDIRLYTPIHEEPVQGREAACQILSMVFSLFDEFHFPDTIAGEKTHALFFRTQVSGVPLEGIDYLRTNAEGQVTEFSVMLRPLKAITTLRRQSERRCREREAARRAQQFSEVWTFSFSSRWLLPASQLARSSARTHLCTLLFGTCRRSIISGSSKGFYGRSGASCPF